MINPKPYGHDVSLVRPDNTVLLYRVHHGQGVAGFNAIYQHYRWGHVSLAEGLLLQEWMEEVIQLQTPKVSMLEWFSRLLVKALRIPTEEACSGK